MKTAGVCRAATGIGAILPGADFAVIDVLRTFGDNLGMAFQIVDDALAYDGRPALIGKPPASDLSNRRVTLPMIYAMNAGGLEVRNRIGDLFSRAGDSGDGGRQQLAELMVATRSLDRARARACRFTSSALRQLDLLPSSESRKRSRTLATVFIMARDQ